MSSSLVYDLACHRVGGVFVDLVAHSDGWVSRIPVLTDDLAQLTDPRRSRGQRYDLLFLLLVLVMAVLAGATSIAGVLRWAGTAPEDVLSVLARGGRTRLPAHSTFSRLLSRLDGDELDDAFSRYTAALLAPGDLLPDPASVPDWLPSEDMPELEPGPAAESAPAEKYRVLRWILVLRWYRGTAAIVRWRLPRLVPASTTELRCGPGAWTARACEAPRPPRPEPRTWCRSCGMTPIPLQPNGNVDVKTNEVRHEAPCRIPDSVGMNSEGGSWARRLTWIRKVKGTRACRSGHRPCPDAGSGAVMGPRDMAKAGLLESQSPVMQVFIHRKWRLKPVPCPASVYFVGGCTFRDAGDAQ